ncbi:MAG TPA: metallophosphoesterase, partial [Rhodothermales bacterium]|nr:metallophosphoesterase [Rhodothermales bacterium]
MEQHWKGVGRSRWLRLRRGVTTALLVLLFVNVGACGTTRLAGLLNENAEQPPDSLLVYTVYLVGDAGNPYQPNGTLQPQLKLLDAQVEKESTNAALVFLGDNIYPTGMPPASAPTREDAEARILAQIDIGEDIPGPVVFIPGNHDWGGAGLGGDVNALRRQEEFVESHIDKPNAFLPNNGFPGPEVVQLTDSLLLVALDTEWWLEPNKVYGNTGTYDLELQGEFLVRLDDILRLHADEKLLVVGHHPMYSNGEHGGYFRSSSLLPVPLSRGYLGTPQDLSNRHYRVLRQGLLSVFRQHPGLIYASGHDHNLQYFRDGKQHYIVSGAGSKDGYVAHGHGEIFARESPGYARLKYYRNGAVWLEFWAPSGDGSEGEMIFSAAVNEPNDVTEPEPAVAAAPKLGTPVVSVTDTMNSVSGGAAEHVGGETGQPGQTRGTDGVAASPATTPSGQSTGSRGGTVIEGAGPPSSQGTAQGGGEAVTPTAADSLEQAEVSAEIEEALQDENVEPRPRPPHLTYQVPFQFCSDSTVTVSAGRRYTAGPIRRLLFGSGYRDVWRAPIQVPVLDMGCTAGGLTPFERGGGLQTFSLHVVGGDGDEYHLRSIDKDPTKSIPPYLRETIAAYAVQDMISALNPYGAFIIPPLARAANILHTDPTLTYIPDTPRLGIYRSDYSNMLSMIEIKPDENQSDEARFGYSTNIVGTDKLLEELEEDNDESIDIAAWIRARLFDMLVGDWDRNEGNWRWAEFEGEYGTVYEPVPYDRDAAFFRFHGLPRRIARSFGGAKMRRLTDFGPRYGDVLGLNYNGAFLDHRITGPASEAEWIRIADSLKQVITDQVIEEAVHEWPEPVFDRIGPFTIRALKARRDKLPKVAARYFRLLSHAVDLLGSGKHERFEVRGFGPDSLEVTAYKTHKEGDVVRELYRRTFYADVTAEVRIYGLGGNDTFVLTGDGGTGIRVRMIGGEGEDRLVDQTTHGAEHVSFYDTVQGATVVGETKTDLTLSSDPMINTYTPSRIEVTSISPVASFGYNETSGLFIGGGIKIIDPAWRKHPYGEKHLLTANFAVRERAYNVDYQGYLVDLWHHWDGDLRARALALQNLRSFYGIGNETAASNRDRYRARLQWVRLMPTLTKQIIPFSTLLAPFSHFSFGPRFEYANIESPKGAPPDAPNAGSLFTRYDFVDKYYAGAYTSFVINGLDTLVAKQSGVRWANEA